MDITYHMDLADLQDCINKIFGNAYIVSEVSKMVGGAQKVVYKIDCVNRFSCVLYVWDLSMNYFKEEILNNDIHKQSYGSDFFEMNNKYLLQHGIRTPSLFYMDKSRERYPFDYALVEYVDGQKAEFYFEHPDSQVRDKVFQQLGDMMTAGAWLAWAQLPENGFFYLDGQNGFIPQRGDIVIYEKLLTDHSHDHTGIVLSCNDHEIVVAEGNTDNQNYSSVLHRDRWHCIFGYIRIPNDYHFDFSGDYNPIP